VNWLKTGVYVVLHDADTESINTEKTTATRLWGSTHLLKALQLGGAAFLQHAVQNGARDAGVRGEALHVLREAP